jgi:hypothetical protein
VIDVLYVCFVKSFLQHFISEWLSAPIFRACTPFMQVPYVPECPWEQKALAWVGYTLWRQGNNLPCGVFYSEFLDFFLVWGEHSVNHGWLCSEEDVHQMCGHRRLLHQSTMGLAQEWTPPRQCAQRLAFNFNKATKWISGTVLLLIHSNTQYIS